jgi:arylsulfatase A-like enzyme
MEPNRPNVILIVTDDQGYGNMACHGNPNPATPHLDRLHGECVRLSDFHVDPMCAPSRAAILTGRYSARPGVGGECIPTARGKACDRAPQTDSSGLQRLRVGQVAQSLSTHDGVHQSVVSLHERVQAFTTPCLRLVK